MRKIIHQEIESVSIPDELLPAIKRVNGLILESIERDGVPIDSGLFDIDSTKIDGDISFALFIVRWVSKVEEVIKNLNIILSDLKLLPNNHHLLAGTPSDRYYLLLRTCFYEFYRFREIHNQIFKESANRGFIAGDQVAIHRKIFHDAFKEVIDLRNMLVHGSPVWKGESHIKLLMHGVATEMGFGLKNIESGKIIDVSEDLEDSCTLVYKTFSAEGNRMSKLISQLIQWHIHAAPITHNSNQ